MDVVNEILLWLHFIGLVLGGGSLLGAGMMSRVLADGAQGGPALGGLGRMLSMAGRGGLALLIITGPLLLWLKWGGMPPDELWFNVKMVLVLIVIAGTIWFGIASKRGSPASRPARIITSVALVLTVLAAVLTFQ